MFKKIINILIEILQKTKHVFSYIYKQTIQNKDKNYDKYCFSLKIVSKGRYKNLYNQEVTLQYGRNTFVDPEVIIDSPDLIKIGSNCIIRKGVVIRPEGGEIIIQNNCVINHYCTFHGKGGVYIGDWTIISPHCGFYAQNHSYSSFNIPITQQENIGKGIYLMGDNWIGGHSVICDDVTLGKGVIIGANSTVTKSIPMATIAVGSPARVIKKRYTEMWEFHKVERASSEGMPIEIQKHVKKRGQLIKNFVSEDDNILDVGCGEGIITSILADKNQNIIGCDYALEALSKAKKQYPHIKFLYSNSTNLRFKNEIFSKVVFSDLAEHLLPIQLIKSLNEIKRVLIKGGILILTTPLTGRRENTSTYAHIYEYSEIEIKKILVNIFSRNANLVDKEFGIFIAQK